MFNGLIAYFVNNRVAANLLMVFLLICGLVGGYQLTVQLYPDFDLRKISLTIHAPGSSPKEIEQDINRRLEERILGLRGVERVISLAENGVGNLIIELSQFADSKSVLSALKSKIDEISKFPPRKTDRPEVKLIQLESEVLTIGVASEILTENERRLVAEKIKSDLLSQPSISNVEIHGVRDREITIELNEEQLRRYKLTLAGVARSIRRESANLSFGQLHTDAGDIVLHSIAKRSRGEDFENIPIITRIDGSIITLADVATIRDGFTDQQVHSELNGLPAAFISVYANEHQSISEISQTVNDWLVAQSYPDHVAVEILKDRAEFAAHRIREIISNGILGILLVFICLVLVLDLRIAFWITFGIPLAFVGSLLFLAAADLSFNVGTIFAFFLLVGIVVDDAVVVGESIAVHRKRGKNPLEAAIDGAKTMVGPITVGVLTTAIALTPFIFITAERYQVLEVVAYVAFFVLLISLIEAFLILPAHLSFTKSWSLSPLSDLQNRVSDWLDMLRDQIVVPIVSWSVRHYILTPTISILVVVASLVLLISGAVSVVIPDQSRNSSNVIRAELYFPVGTPFGVTMDSARELARAAQLVDKEMQGESVRSISMVVGLPIKKPRNIGIRKNPDQSHIAAVTVYLNEVPQRSVSVPEFELAWREKIGTIPFADRLDFQSTKIELQPGIEYSLSHDDRDVLHAATREFKQILEFEPGVYGLSDNLDLGEAHFDVKLSPAGVSAGLTPAGVGAQLRASFHGLEVQRIQRGHDEIKVMVRYPRDRRENLNELWDERLIVAAGKEIPFEFVADVTESRELAKLLRIDGRKSSIVEGYVDETVTTPFRISRKIQKEYFPELLDEFPGLEIELEGDARQVKATFDVLGLFMPLALLAMYIVCAAFLGSYWKPLIIVFGLPAALAGAIFLHWVLGWDFNAMSVFGVIGVLGVVVNDGLILLDRYNYLRKSQPNLPAIAAASGAMRHRFRAVFLTTLTTVLGLSPILYERSEELMNLVPFVVSMLGGLIFASLFTLFILPTLVMLIVGRRE